MTRLTRIGAGSAFLAAVVVFGSPSASFAKPTSIDPDQVRVLATQIQSALSGLGCGASLKDDVNAIDGAIAVSGADPAVVLAALRVVETTPGLCASVGPALASAEQTVLAANDSGVIPAAGGPGGGSPIGAPAAYVSGGGSDYLVR